MTKRKLPAQRVPSVGNAVVGTSPCGKGGLLAMAICLALGSGAACAFEFDTEAPDLKVRWDNTVKYSSAWRLNNADTTLTANPNQDDGDRNFKKGQISNRFDLLSELDIAYQNVGARVSAAAWYDSKYLGNNDNPGFVGGAFPNQLSVPANQFTSETKHIHGQGAEFLDAFVYGKFDLGDKRTTVRAGKHALVWGESMFFGSNAIAGGMAPVDVVKLVSVPNTQFKEAIRPVQQLSGQIQVTPDVSIGAFYQFRWAPNRLPAVGSYFSQLDSNPNGAEQLLLAGPGSPFAANAPRLDDQRASNSGQGGIQVRFRSDEADYGIYLIRFHDKNFQQVTNVGLAPTVVPAVACGGAFGPAGVALGGTCYLAGGPVSYRLAYHEGITAFGGSVSRTFGDINLAAEASIRHNQDLASSGAFDASALGAAATNNSNNPGYATGNTAHFNASMLWSMQPTVLFNEATLLAEMAWNRVLHVDHNPINGAGVSVLDPRATRDAVAFRGLFTPTYRQVWSGVDLEVPIGLGFAPKGSRSMAIGPGAFPSDGGGDFSVGVNAIYLDAWRIGVNYTHYFGPEGTFVNAANGFSYKQSLADRDFIAFSLRTTF
ncbi:MAG: DUF1302 domain-containing protein [Rhodocyclaceae bacterium]|nr:MAG: DUF1302 domain-containing protein [Rhodocyclaceae bacterium]